MSAEVFQYAGERFADIQMLRYQVPGFDELTLRQKTLIYHLSQASLLGRDILWDQNGRFNLRLRRILEAVYTHFSGDRSSADFAAFAVYMKRVWFSNGIHHHYGCEKFQPGFTQEFLHQALGQLQAEHIALGYSSLEALEQELFPVIFDPSVMPKRVNQAAGEDLLLTSACNYYAPGITQAEAEEFYARQKAEGDQQHPIMYGMNSRLERAADGSLHENVWRADGMYGAAIRQIVQMLSQAIPYAENERQQSVIRKLIEFYETGNLAVFDAYTILWVEETEGEVDFTNGFTEVYGDPLGLKASWEGYVNYTDHQATRRAQALSRNAQWFEDHSPVDARFKKPLCRGVSAKVINAAILGGDLYPSSAIGINLPNSNWVRAEHGSKSVTIANLTHAYDEAARGNGFRNEFADSTQTVSLMDRYGSVCDDLHTDLHECLGHGSGRLLPGVDPDALKAYGSTIEEARADLFGLYYLADEKLVELGLTPCQEAYKAQYYSYMMNGLLTQMVRIQPGHQIEEAHMRNRALIARWTLEHYPQAVRLSEQDGKHYVEILDYPLLRTAFGTLLAEIQRIKSEGDLQAARQMVERYGVQIDAKLHQEVLERYSKLNLAPYKGFINPRYTPIYDQEGHITDVHIDYLETYDEQMLRYSKQYNTLI
ncbi:MAG: dipeptidyl peptidase 3 [Prevotellaceae bacterium]|nr:dipeptidyl peptidase 3 [Prevotellaceae bacterium]MDY5672536.1 dihydrofolate reductase [Bacteroidaceae bacterium]